jgi:predicted TIM-barrel fold metal-dependent hydrolase
VSCAALRVARAALAIGCVLFTACRREEHQRANALRTEPSNSRTAAHEGGFADHHVHVIGPGLLRDWKQLGAEFSRSDEHYLRVDPLFEGPDALAAAVLVPMAHFCANAELRIALGFTLEEERDRVRAENDHVAREAARHPGRAVALAAVDLLRPYALDELQRARREHGVAGAKVHLASAGFDFRDAAHLAALERIVAWTASERIPLLVHLDPQLRGTTVEDLRHLLEVVFGPHPDAEILIAHLGGSGGFGSWPQSVLKTCGTWLAAEREAGRAREKFCFDLAAVPLMRDSEGLSASGAEEIAALAPALRELGLQRVLYGSDYPVFDPREHLRFLAERCGFRRDELERIRLQRWGALARLRPTH